MRCRKNQPGALLVAVGVGILLACCLPSGFWCVLVALGCIALGCWMVRA